MKRYKDISYTLARISPLREDENGDYVKYEDMENVITNFINNLLHWDNAREVAQIFIKEYRGGNGKI